MPLLSFLLRERSLKLTSISQASSSLQKGVTFCLHLLERAEVPGLEEYHQRAQLLCTQLARWGAKAPGGCEQTYTQQVAAGTIEPLDSVLSKSLPHIQKVLAQFDGSVAAAMAVRDATVLACVAGDAPNLRPGAPGDAPRRPPGAFPNLHTILATHTHTHIHIRRGVA